MVLFVKSNPTLVVSPGSGQVPGLSSVAAHNRDCQGSGYSPLAGVPVSCLSLWSIAIFCMKILKRFLNLSGKYKPSLSVERKGERGKKRKI